MILFLLVQCLTANEKNITLLDLTELLSSQNNINVYIDEEIKAKEVSLFVPEHIRNEDFLHLYRQSVKKLGYDVTSFNNTYYLTKTPPNELYPYFFDLKTNSFEAVSKYLAFKKIEFQYIDTTNVIIFFCKQQDYPVLYKDISKIDSQKKQVTLKFTIIEINEDDLKEQGFEFSTTYKTADDSYRNVLNTFILPFQSTKPVFMRSTFYSALKLFNEFQFFKISQNPYVLAQDGKDFIFSAVNNIPYQTSTTITEATNTSEQTTIEYKDVGLKIIGKTLIYDDYINLDLDLIIEDILSTSNNIPTTYKRQLKSNSNLKYGEVLILSGINQTKINKTEFSIPFISNIPYLGELFKYKSDSEVKSNISIAIEVIK
jgi:type II secretory pathway component GspD/PulD (secretin)